MTEPPQSPYSAPEPQSPYSAPEPQYSYEPPPPFGNPEFPPSAYPSAPPPSYGPPPGYGPPPSYGPPPGYQYDYLAGNPLPYPPAPPRRSRRVLWICLAVVAGVAAIAIAATVGNSKSPTNFGPAALSPSASDTATDGVVVQSLAGQFRARFPSQPDEQTVPESIGGVSITVHVARTRSPITEIATETTSTAIPSDQYQTTMRIAMTSFAAPGNLTIDSQSPMTFRGRPARTAAFTAPTGEHISAIVFFYNGTRMYYLVAQTGSPFDELVASFVALA